MSLLDALMAPHFNGLHLILVIIGIAALWFALRPAPAPAADDIPLATEVRNPYFNLKPCSCPSGDCPEWEHKAGLDNPDPDCPIHGTEMSAAA